MFATAYCHAKIEKFMSENKEDFFVKGLLAWAQKAERPLPWKYIKNPYHIWLSEILLQQTRAEQGLPYYEKFVARFPTVEDLANASEDEVLKHWQGLGYYARARNLHKAAQHITYNLQGIFPNTYEDILALSGVGEYTAAAIASFAFNLPYAVVDGNVYRVLSRFFGIHSAIDSSQGKKEFAQLAEKILDKENAGYYNQAIMDFGATHCMPRQPLCNTCPLQKQCYAYQNKQIAELPFKEKKIQKKKRIFYYFVYKYDNNCIIKRRGSGDVWEGLYDFPLIEKTDLESENNIIDFAPFSAQGNIQIVGPYKQVLTHLEIAAFFIEIQLENPLEQLDNPYIQVTIEDLKNHYALPKIITQYLSKQQKQSALF